MILIDLQNTFDAINYKILLGKMTFFNFSPSTIAWFRSYLTNRSFIVDVDSTLSEPAELVCGVPQGSILGPLLFYFTLMTSLRLLQTVTLGYMLMTPVSHLRISK